jgi:hypothetical protein
MAAKPLAKAPRKEDAPEQPVIPFEKFPETLYHDDHTVGSLLDACLAAKGPMTDRK